MVCQKSSVAKVLENKWDVISEDNLNTSHYEHTVAIIDNKIEILSLDIEKYPNIVAEIQINDGALLSLNGIADEDNMSLNYHLRGDTFKWDEYNITNSASVKGKMEGNFSELFISGEGEIFHGKTMYQFTRKLNRLEDVELTLKSVDSKLLLDFLKYEKIVAGKVDVLMDFEYFSSYQRKGLAKISMKKATMLKVLEGSEFSLESKILVKNLLYKFSADINSDIGKLRLANGYYNKSADSIKAEYGLHINELSYFEELLGHQYQGELNTAGNLSYEMEKLTLLGDSLSYGGLLEYNYQNNYLDLKFQGVSLEKILRQLSFPALLSSKIYGTASYDIEDEIILVDTKLKETRFRRTNMTDKIYEMADIDVLKDVYDDSIFTAGYQDDILTSRLKIDNGVNHLYLKNTRMNSKTNKITADFEVMIDDQEFFGEVYGTLEDPKVSVDMSKLIQYQINKKIDNFFGRGKPLKQNNIKKKLNDIEFKEIKQTTRSFLDGFFD
jgi:hypothetical protein